MSYSARAAVGAAAILGSLAVGCDAGADASVTCPAPGTTVFEAADVSLSESTPKHRQSIDTAFQRALAMAARCPDVEAHLVVFVVRSRRQPRRLRRPAHRDRAPTNRARAHNLKVAVLPKARTEVAAGGRRGRRRPRPRAPTLSPASTCWATTPAPTPTASWWPPSAATASPPAPAFPSTTP